MVSCKECKQNFESLDSLRRHRVQKHKVSSEQTYIDYVLKGVEPTCKCGCKMKPKFLGVDSGFRDYLRGHASRVKNNWGHNQKALDKSHATQKIMHEEGTLSVWNKGLTVDDVRVRDNIDKVMASPERGNKISKALTGVKKSKEHVRKIKEHSKTRWESKDEREKQSHRRMQYIIKNGFSPKSKLEDRFNIILMEKLSLKEHHDYYRQYYVREIKALFDFKISGKPILIEVDGDYWHCNPNSIYKEAMYATQKGNLIQDKIKENWCEANGIKLLRFWETDINQRPEWVVEQLEIALS